MTYRISSLLMSTAFLASAVSCSKSATEIIVTVDTSLGVPCALDRLVIDVTNSSGETVSETVDVDASSLPGSLTLIASETPGQLVVRVTGKLGEDVVVATAEERAVVFEDETSKELRFLLDSSCSPGPCGAVSQSEFTDLPAPTARIECGQERYTTRDSLALLTNACSGETAGTVFSAGQDEVEVVSPLDPAIPFPFFFYGRPVSNLWIGDNGYLAFSSESPNALNSDIGDPRSLGAAGGFPEPGILPFWDKLAVGQETCFRVVGNEPNRIMWVTWDRACFGPTCGTAEQGTLTFSAGLEESTNSIHLGYQTMTANGANAERADGLTAVIGITNGNVPNCEADVCTEEGLCPDGTACGYTEFSALSTSLTSDPLPQIELRPVTTE